jgi:hypothetical protein
LKRFFTWLSVLFFGEMCVVKRGQYACGGSMTVNTISREKKRPK